MLRFSVVVFVGLRYPTNNNITVATGVSTINLATDSCTMEALYHKHVHLSTHTHTYLLRLVLSTCDVECIGRAKHTPINLDQRGWKDLTIGAGPSLSNAK